jgi:hypothetical protein
MKHRGIHGHEKLEVVQKVLDVDPVGCGFHGGDAVVGGT